MLRYHIKLLILLILLILSLSWNINNKNDSSKNDSNSDTINRERDRVYVDLSLGRVIGYRDGRVNVFLGIPFAEPPIGKNRFRPPKPKRQWRPAIYKAMEFSPECLQSTLFSSDTDSIRDEDCLYLNVWAPLKTRPDQIFPVMLWLYGGAFMHGAASKQEYIGNRLAERGVIVVSCNYRLGALGFLVSLNDGLFGNYGLHDQKMAMQWVQDHIQNFGGDINRVTLFGESAGAMSIGLHLLDQQLLRQLHQRKARFNSSNYILGGRYNMMSSGGRKLFHSVILQSNPLGYKYRTVAVANFIGSAFKEQLDCEDLRCLQSESADELMHVQDTLMAVPRSMGDFFTWGPVLTDQSYQREIRLRPGPVANVSVRQPIDTMRELQQLDIPVIMGTTSHEGTVFVFTAFPTRMAKIIYQGLVYSFFRTSAPQVLKLYSSLSKYISESPYPDYRLALSTIIGDYLFRCPNQLFAKQLTASRAKVYLYEFALPTRTPGYPCCDGLACHTAELPYVFNNMDVIENGYSWYEPGSISFETKLVKQSTNSNSKPFPDIFGAASSWFGRQDNNNNEEDDGLQYRQAIDKKVSKLLADFWTNFATYGDPNGDTTSTEGTG